MNKKKSPQPSLLRRTIRRALFFVISYLRARPKLFAMLVRLVSRVPIFHAHLKAFYHTHNSTRNASGASRSSSSGHKFHEGHYFQRQLERELSSRKQKHRG